MERLDRTVSTIERMEKWEGSPVNWYDTTTLKPLPPYYVSTVDSGNLVVSLIAVREGLEQWLALDGEGLTARELAAREQALRVAFAEELTPDLRTLDEESPESAANDAKDAEDAADGWKRKGLELVKAYRYDRQKYRFSSAVRSAYESAVARLPYPYPPARHHPV